MSKFVEQMPNIEKIPVYLISFNRVEYLQCMVSFLEESGFKNIHIIDNASTYSPLLEYLKMSPHQIHYMNKNYGHMVLFEHPDFKKIIDHQYFILSDPDVLPIKDCPADFYSVFYKILEANPQINKVGFSLKIDDLPDFYALKQNVIDWEYRFYLNEEKFDEMKIYHSPIDTTFALYRPRLKWKDDKNFFSAIRTGFPYTARHLPWYKDLSLMTEEDVFYNLLDIGAGNWNGSLSGKDIEKKHMQQKKVVTIIKLFGFIPLLEIRSKEHINRIFLFRFIPLGHYSN